MESVNKYTNFAAIRPAQCVGWKGEVGQFPYFTSRKGCQKSGLAQAKIIGPGAPLLYLPKNCKAMISHIEHIGIAVENLTEAIAYYENVLGLKCYAIEEIADQKVRTAFFQVGQTKVELLETTDPDGPVGKFIEKRGPGLHHLAFAVDDVNRSLQEVADKGVRLIDQQARPGAEGLQIGFLHPKSTLGALTELCGKK